MDYNNGYGYQNNGMSYGSGNVDEYGQGMNYGSSNNNYGNTSYSGSGAPAAPTKSYTPKQVIPIVSSMIGRLIFHNTDSFKYFDTSVVNVCICGLVSSYRVNSGSIEYVINDCTGILNTRLYTDSTVNELTEGYVRIVGALKEFNGEIIINIHNIEPVFDMNIVTEHVLSSIASYLYYKKKGSIADTMVDTGIDGMNNQNNMGVIEQTILSFVKSNMNKPEYSEGVPLDLIAASLAPNGLSKDDVKGIVEGMISNITLYETGMEMYTC